MTEDDKKNLTKWMGKCWHEEIEACKCSCGRNFGDSLLLDYHIEDLNRTYDSDADMLALFRKLVEKVLWGKFWELADKAWNKDDTTYIETYEQYDEQAIIRWLFLDPERFCSLVAEFKPWDK